MAANSSVYPANKGEIASPADNSVVDSLKESSHTIGGSAVNHNKHVSVPKGEGHIETPATDGIVKSSF